MVIEIGQKHASTRVEEPKAEMATCVAGYCRKQIAQHEAFRVTVEVWEPWIPTRWQTIGGGANSAWQHSVSTWSAAGAAMLTAGSGMWPSGPVKMPDPTHERHTYTGWACCREHADRAVEAKAKEPWLG